MTPALAGPYQIEHPMRTLPLVAFAAALSLTNVGCIKQMLLDGQISATRDASGVLDTIGDYEIAAGAAKAAVLNHGWAAVRPRWALGSDPFP